MAERKAVIKSADMSEDMQQDAVDCASQALEKYNIEKVSGSSHHSPSDVPLSIPLRTLLLTLRKSLIRNITPHGIVLWEETLVPMSRMRQSISSISI